MNLTFRPYSDSDLFEISELFYNTVHKICKKDYSPAQLGAWAPDTLPYTHWADSFKNRCVLLASSDGKIVAFGDIDRSGYLDRFYVHCGFQGMGIGTQLLKKLECSVSAPKLYLYSSITAKPFFEKMGYTAVRKNLVHRNGVVLTNFLMEKAVLTSSQN